MSKDLSTFLLGMLIGMILEFIMLVIIIAMEIVSNARIT